LIEHLSGEQVDKRIPNATYTLQMLENLLTAFKFMDRVGVVTDGYTVKDVFNGNEEKIIMMFDAIRARFPEDSPKPKPSSSISASTSSSTITSATATPSINPSPSPKNYHPSAILAKGSPSLSNGRSPLIGTGNAMFGTGSTNMNMAQQPQRMQTHRTVGSEFEALYDEAARSTVVS
jgi:hypothetical protein